MATAIAPDERVAADPYAELVAFFDRFAEEEPRWKRRNSTYHRLVRQLMRFNVPPGARVLEIGCGSGDLLAALQPSHGVGVDVSPKMVELRAQRASRSSASRRSPARSSTSARRSTTSSSPTSMPYVHDLLALFERVARALARAHARRHQLVQPRLAPDRQARRGAPAEAAQAAPQLGRRRTTCATCSSSPGFEIVTSHSRILFPKRVPLLLDVPERLPREPLAVQPALRSPTGSSPGRCRRQLPAERRLDRLPVPERAGPRRPADRAAARLRGADRADLRRGQLDRRHARRDPAPDRARTRSATSASSPQPGKGKGDAVRVGLRGREARRADDPRRRPQRPAGGPAEVLPRRSSTGRAELVNGSRLVYDMEPGAMRFLNMLGNKLVLAAAQVRSSASR